MQALVWRDVSKEKKGLVARGDPSKRLASPPERAVSRIVLLIPKGITETLLSGDLKRANSSLFISSVWTKM